MFFSLLLLYSSIAVVTTGSPLSEELCLCTRGCAQMSVISEYRPYVFTYNAYPITDDKQYQWMGYISFPADRVFISGNSLDISCASSDVYTGVFFAPLVQYSANTCVYNTSFTDLFISLRTLSSTQTLTLYFDEDRRRNLCGFCGCNSTCENALIIIFSVIIGLMLLLLLFFLLKNNCFNLKKLLSYRVKVTAPLVNSNKAE